MTYTFKLSRRLARIPVLFVAALIGLAGCEGEAPSEPGAEGLDTSLRSTANLKVVVVPDSVMLEIGQGGQFKAYARNNRGDSSGVNVSWYASGGTITSRGAFTAAAAGTYKVYARSRNRIADSAIAVVVPHPASLSRIVLTPDTATVLPSATRTFSAIGEKSDSSTVPVGTTWAATGGSIDAGGVYTAGKVPGKYRVIATATGGLADTAAVTIPDAPAPTLVRVILTPGTATLAAGATQQFAAYGRSSTGDSMAVAVTYSATGGSITNGGLFTAGNAAGTFRVVALQAGGTLADTAAVTVSTPTTTPPPPPPPPGGKTISPTGVSSGNCTATPCSLSYALGGAGGTLVPGDTIWLRGGTYPGDQDARIQNGTNPRIVFRQYPGERATLTGQLFVSGTGMTFWGFEVANRDPGRQPDFIGVQIAGGNTSFINIVSHDWTGNGFYASWTAPNVEIAGCLVYNNGSRGSTSTSHGHGIYAQNDGGTGRKLFRDNILLNQYGYGFHLYSGTTGRLANMTIQGNTVVNSGNVSGKAHPNILYGYGAGISGAVIADNRLYTTDRGSTTFEVGGENGQSSDATITGNVAVTGWPMFSISNVTSARVTDNTFVGIGESGSMVNQTGGTSGWTWSNNSFWGSASTAEWVWGSAGYTFSQWRSATGFGAGDTYASGKPSGQWVTVRPNPYEAGRALVTIYNWSNAGSVTITVPGLATGRGYEVRNAQRFWDAPVASGTYGGSINIPLSSVTPYTTVTGDVPPSTGNAFHVFVVVPTAQ